jgi:large conductance mechanosensitive channel
LAIAVVRGAASGKVVTALVDKVIMPPIGLALGKVGFVDLKLVLQPGVLGPDGKEIVKEVAIGYGAAIQSVIDFIIVAFVVFLVVKGINRFKKAAPPPEPPGRKRKLLTEIRDALRARK